MLLVILPFLAFVMAVATIVAIILVAYSASRWAGRMFSYLMLLMTTSSIVVVMISPRILRIEQPEFSLTSTVVMESGFWAKLPLVAVIGCSFALCVAWFCNVQKKTVNRFHQRDLHAPRDILIAFMFFYVAFSILPLFFGKRYYFHVSLIYPFFVFLALFFWLQVSRTDPVVIVKQCLALIVFSSLIAAALVPEMTVQPSYSGLIPGFNSRLWGLTAGANALGSVAGMLLVLEVAEPSQKRTLRLVILGSAALALIMTQSKTSIMGAALGLVIVSGWRMVAGLRFTGHTRSVGSSQIVTTIIGSLLVLTLFLWIWTLFSDSSVLASMEGKLAAPAVGKLSTASGRTWIWEVAIRGGLENPLFGQGADFWNLDNRRRLGLGGAVHAHNLFLEVFARSGLVGLMTLLVFLFFLVTYSMRAAKATRGGSVAVMMVFLMRAIFEVPIQPNAILGAEFFAMAAYFFYVIDRGARPLRKVRVLYSNYRNPRTVLYSQ